MIYSKDLNKKSKLDPPTPCKLSSPVYELPITTTPQDVVGYPLREKHAEILYMSPETPPVTFLFATPPPPL
jgi:hypothetical protein